MSHLMNTYARLPLAITHGEGAWVYGQYDGGEQRFLDALAGIAVNTVGHNHPRLVKAIADQASKVIHTSNLYEIPLQSALADKLCALSGMEAAFFGNSGLEANEACIKLGRKFGHDKGIASPEIVVYERAFHGRSLATLSATGNAKVQKGFEPLVQGFVRVPLNDVAALEQVASTHPNVSAVFLEAIQGEGGINPARADYLQAARRLCDAKGWLLIIDEVQCGMGRSGKWFAHQHAGVMPDVVAMAKGLASGVPVGAVLARGAAAAVFGPGNHGTTFGGNPLAMRAALETIAIIEDEGLLDNAARVGGWLMDALRQRLGGHAGVRDIRGQGLMIGVELAVPCGALVRRALDRGVLINVTNDTVVRLLPPLIFTLEQAQLLVDTLVPLIESLLDESNSLRKAA
ncbi:MAG: aspartate aminotransferase family protein [Betaproteobacteria bacterium]|nr:aspartate aminotransferase family protein [Betaproteobacteria bacterium]